MSDSTAADAATTTDDEVKHTIETTRKLTRTIRDALDELELVEDVWNTVARANPKVTDPEKAAWGFTIEGDDDLLYRVTVTPSSEGE